MNKKLINAGLLTLALAAGAYKTVQAADICSYDEDMNMTCAHDYTADHGYGAMAGGSDEEPSELDKCAFKMAKCEELMIDVPSDLRCALITMCVDEAGCHDIMEEVGHCTGQ